MDKQPSAVADIERAIRLYLQAHRHALDTERGIREWWLRDTHPHCFNGDVQLAIEHLVAAGEMAELTLPDGQRAYASANQTIGPRPLGPS